ncbi:hypothetical protein FFR93_11685 [Rhizobium sp. MHM7A]|nr:hypothetical protein FFR93_11685 [Rhizobium sp. MHM7A]
MCLDNPCHVQTSSVQALSHCSYAIPDAKPLHTFAGIALAQQRAAEIDEIVRPPCKERKEQEPDGKHEMRIDGR